MKNSRLLKALKKHQDNATIQDFRDFELVGNNHADFLIGGGKCPDKCFINRDKEKGSCTINRCRQNCKKNHSDPCE